MRLLIVFRRNRCLRVVAILCFIVPIVYLLLSWYGDGPNTVRNVIQSKYSSNKKREAPKLITGKFLIKEKKKKNVTSHRPIFIF